MSKLEFTSPSSRLYKEIQDEMFEYEKLLFKPKNPIPKIDMDDFILDNQKIGEVRTIEGTIWRKNK